MPRVAANVGSNNSYPAANAELYVGNNYNFTSGVRNEANLAQTWDSVNLVVQQSDQVAYSNTSLTPLGTYNATYSFANDRAGGLAADFAYSLGGGGTAQVVASYLGHQQVLQHVGGTAESSITNTFSAQSSGNISVWFRVSDTAAFSEPIRTGVPRMAISGNVFQYYHGDWHTITSITPVANRWYYLEWGFETTGDTFTISIDGIQRDAFNYAFTTLTTYSIITGSTAGMTITIDAVDYSWTPGSSLQRAATDLGRVGVYNATHSFETSAMLSLPAGWTDSSGASCYAKVFPAVATQTSYHHNVLALDDQHAANVAVAYTSFTAMPTGSIEWWMMSTNVANAAYVTTQNAAGTNGIIIFYSGSNLVAINGGGTTTLVSPAVSNTWYHVRVEFVVATHLYNVWVNGLLKATAQAFQSNVDVERVSCSTGAATGFQMYVDALDLSTDSQYYSERSTYLVLNSTTTFPVAGSYSSKWQAWSAGICYDQYPVPFEVTENVQLISNAPIATTWIFSNNPTTSLLYFTDLSLWTGNDGGGYVYYQQPIYQDTYSDQSHHDVNYGSASVVNVETTLGGPCGQSFIDVGNASTTPTAYFLNGDTRTLSEYVVTWGTSLWAYATTYFEESVLTWDNQPAWGANLWGPTSVTAGTYVNITIGSEQYINIQKGTVGDIELGSRESVHPPILWHYMPMFHAEESWVGIQTEFTRVLTLSSAVFAPIQLQPGDMINLGFNTSSSHQIMLNLLNEGVVQQQIEISREGNTNQNSRSVNLTMTFPIVIDQFTISGYFDGEQQIQISFLDVERYATNEYFHTFYLPAYSSIQTSLLNANYTLRVYQGNVLSYSTNISVQPYILNPVYFQPNSNQIRQISFFDQQNNPLEFSLFEVNITATYEGETSTFRLFGGGYAATFSADDNSYYDLNVYDRFGRSLLNRTYYAIETFINITLTLIFSFKIQNRMQDSTILSVGNSYYNATQYILPDEIIELKLWNGTYSLNYSQTELGRQIHILMDITQATRYIINSSLHATYFSCFSNDGLGLSADSVRLYINGTRQNWGVIQTLGLTNVTVLDYVNDVEYSNVLDLSQIAEMNIFVNIATVITHNVDNEQAMSIAIYKNGILLQNQTIGTGSSLSFRFTNGHYDVNCTWANGTVEPKTVDVLASGTDLTTYTLTWGSYHPDLPQEIPTPGFPELLMLIAVIAVIGLIVTWILVAHERSKRKEAERRFYEMSRRGR